ASYTGDVRTVTATRYVTPLREGGSLPGIVEADDDGLYVLKFRGAGQGPKALAAEIVSGELARGLGLPVPELVLVNVDAELDPEIQDLINASVGGEPGSRLPARCAALHARLAARRGAGGGGGMARRAGRERRSHGAQSQPAALARQPVADRPRGLAVRPPRQRRPADRRRAPLPGHPRPRAAAGRGV